MAKAAPIVRDTMLACEIAVTLVADPETVHASIYGVQVTAEHLRSLAEQLDRFEAARNVFFNVEPE